MDAGVLAWLRAQLGTATDQTDLEDRYTRLGSARAVALEVLRERLANMLANPSSVNVSSVVAVSYTENIKALERKIAELESGEPPAPDDPEDGSGGPDSLGMIRLVERRRR